MARLTRTQKYAELRNQLEHSPEVEVTSKDLSKYEDRMNDLHIETTTVKNDDLNVIETIEDAPSVKEKENASFETDKTAQETEMASVPQSESPVKEKGDEVLEEENFEDFEPFDLEESVDKDSFEELKTDEIVELDADEEKIDDNYLNEALNEVNEYNKAQGLLTADDVSDAIVQEIRSSKNQDEHEDDLTNTVTLEIKKILSELDASNKEEETSSQAPRVEAQKEESVKEEDKEAELSSEVTDLLKTYLNDDDDTATGGDIDQTIVATNIASLEDDLQTTKQALKAEADKTLMNETLPLKVDQDKKVQKDEELDVEPRPNKVLNFILTVLILVLIGILIYIAYLILTARGII